MEDNMRVIPRAALVMLALAALCPRDVDAAEVNPGGEVFIDPMDVSGGFLSPLSPLSARPQTEIFLVPAEFHLLQANIPLVEDEHFLHYQMRLGGRVAFARRFELGLEVLPLHVLAARVTLDMGPFGTETYDDTDVNFGNFSAHFLGNIVKVPEFPLYFSGALRVTFPTASDVDLDWDGDDSRDWEALVDSWIFEPQLLFGITLADRVTLSTRQGLAIFVTPGGRYDDPFRGDDQVHWAMNFALGYTPIQYLSLVADFSAMFCMNEVHYWDPESGAGEHDHTHPIFVYLGLGAKVYPIPPLAIEAGFRFGLTDEAQYTTGLFSFALKISYEWDVSIGGVTVIKEGSTAEGGGDAS
jgi:hypothetical protein